MSFGTNKPHRCKHIKQFPPASHMSVSQLWKLYICEGAPHSLRLYRRVSSARTIGMSYFLGRSELILLHAELKFAIFNVILCFICWMTLFYLIFCIWKTILVQNINVYIGWNKYGYKPISMIWACPPKSNYCCLYKT